MRALWGLATLPFLVIFRMFRWLLVSERTSANGYIIKKSESGRKRYEHRQVAEEHLRRRLEKWEVVHHINGQKNDNRPSNLCVMSRADHERYHRWYEAVYKTFRKYPRRSTQLKKLTGTFNGTLLTAEAAVSRAG